MEIEILMFSAEVSVTCRREFAGGEADPRFIDLMPTPAGLGRLLRRVRRGGGLMARQSFIWTALPNGYTADGAACVSRCMLAPRLDPQDPPVHAEKTQHVLPRLGGLAGDARERALRRRVTAGRPCRCSPTRRPGPNRVDTRLGVADSAVWKALFAKANSSSRRFAYKDLSRQYDAVVRHRA